MAHLPDVLRSNEDKDGQGEPLVLLHEMQVWRDLPLLGWETRYYWDDTSIRLSHPDPIGARPVTAEEIREAITKIVNSRRFVALLVATDEPIFLSHAWFALVTLREPLETPWLHRPEDQPLEAWIPAAAAWVEVLGAEIYEWDHDYPRRGGGALGRGGCYGKGSMASGKRGGSFGGRGLGRRQGKKMSRSM